MHATEDIKVQCMFLDTLCVYLEFDFGPVLMVRNLYLKMAIILPTGQWYAPSAVINDAGYCMVLHGIA